MESGYCSAPGILIHCGIRQARSGSWDTFKVGFGAVLPGEYQRNSHKKRRITSVGRGDSLALKNPRQWLAETRPNRFGPGPESSGRPNATLSRYRHPREVCKSFAFCSSAIWNRTFFLISFLSNHDLPGASYSPFYARPSGLQDWHVGARRLAGDGLCYRYAWRGGSPSFSASAREPV
jgi:hypothetical protein